MHTQCRAAGTSLQVQVQRDVALAGAGGLERFLSWRIGGERHTWVQVCVGGLRAQTQHPGFYLDAMGGLLVPDCRSVLSLV